jgi:xylulokinase
MKNIIAIDIGTQSSRAAVVRQDGRILGIHQIKHMIESPHPGWAQQEPESWWKETCQALKAVLKKTGVSRESIAAISVCGQMHGPVGIDDSGTVTTPRVQLWCDKRCSEQCENIRKHSNEADLRRLSGNSILPSWTGIKVRWHKDHEPRVYDRTRWFLVPKDFINYRLTGVAAADPSEASCSFLWDCRTQEYSRKLADAVGVDIRKFAPVHRSHDVIGQVTEKAAGLTGIPAGTPVVAGGGDFPVSMLGFGIVGEGVTADVTGTSTLLAAHAGKPLLDPAIQNLRHVVEGWIPFTLLDCGGLSMKWCKDLVSSMLGREASYKELIAMASRVPAGSEGLIFYPYMLGERRRENTASRGGYFGIGLNHSAPHFVRAVMEGVALAMGKDIGEFAKHGHKVRRLLSVGGGTRNELWNKIKASITGAPIELSEEPEAGLKGAALLGAAGVGLIDDIVQTAISRRAKTRTIYPDRKMMKQYREVQKEYVRIYEHMLGFWYKEEGK